MAKKSTKKKVAKKKVAKKATPKKVTSKKVAKKKVSKKKVTKKAPSKKKVTKKTSAKKVTKKKVTKKKTTKKKVAKASAVKKSSSKKKLTPKTSSKKSAPSKAPKSKKITARKPIKPFTATVKTNGQALAVEEREPPSLNQLKRAKSGLTRKQMNFLKTELMERRAEILGDIASLGQDNGSNGNLSHMPVHMADVGTDYYEREFTLGLMESERRLVREIDEALIRMKDGYYGVCLETGEPIGFARLEFKPWAKYSIEVARQREKRGL